MYIQIEPKTCFDISMYHYIAHEQSNNQYYDWQMSQVSFYWNLLDRHATGSNENIKPKYKINEEENNHSMEFDLFY